MACGCCLYGPYTAVPLIFSFVATLLTWFITWDCRFFDSTQNNLFWLGNNGVPLRSGQDFTFSVGPWTVQDFYPNGTIGTVTPITIFDGNVVVDDNSCTVWSEHESLNTDDLDAPLRWTRGMTIVASYSTIILFPLVFCMLFATYPRVMLWVLSTCFFLESTLVILSFILLISYLCEDAKECKLLLDAYLSIAAWVFWVGAAISILFCKDVQRWGGYDQPRGTTVETVDEIVDEKTGAVQIITLTVTVDDDGKVFTKEVREPQPLPRKYATKTGLSVTDSSRVQESAVTDVGEEDTAVEEEADAAEEAETPANDENPSGGDAPSDAKTD